MQPTLADALFAVLLFRGLQLGASAYFNDPGTGWHLRNGAEILSSGRVPLTDGFSHTRGGQPWVETQWLGDVVMQATFTAGGYALMALVTAVILALLFRWIYRTHVIGGGWPAMGLLVALAAAGAASGHFLARPLLATTVGVPLSFWWASQYARGQLSIGRLVWLVPLAVAWTNVHPGVLGGLVTVGLCGAGTIVGALLTGRTGEQAAAFRRGAMLMTVAAGMAAATLVNPYGLAWHEWVIRLMHMPALGRCVQEWMPPVWTEPDTLGAMFLLSVAIVAGVACRHRTRFAEALVVAFWVIQAAQSYRHLPLAAMVVALQLGRLLADVQGPGRVLGRFVGALRFAFRPGLRAAERAGGGLMAAMLIAAATVFLFVGRDAGASWVRAMALADAGPPRERYSPGVVGHLLDHPPRGPIFNTIDYGGQIIRHVPAAPVFIDDRFGLYGERFVTDYVAAVGAPARRLGVLLDRWGIETIVVDARGNAAQWLDGNSSWRNTYRDGTAAVYVRDSSAPGDKPPVARRAGVPIIGDAVMTSNR